MRLYRWWSVAFLLSAIAGPANAAPSDLNQFKAAIDVSREQCPGNLKTRGASPSFADAKRLLIGVVEARVARLAPDEDPAPLANRLAEEVRKASVDAAPGRCFPDSPSEDEPFAEASVELTKNGRLLQVVTSLSIECGSDESAYLYEWNGESWHRVWQMEQSLYTDKGYKPEHVEAVLVTRDTNGRDHLVMTVGRNEWCTSNWRTAHYSLWRAGLGHLQARLLDRSELAFMGEVDGPLAGRLDANGAYVEFIVGSIDPDVHSRFALRHYVVQGSSVRRSDPIALNPQNFVEEWLSSQWSESSNWSEILSRQSLRYWHEAARNGGQRYYFGEIRGQPLHCRNQANLWQVGVKVKLAKGNPTPLYFLVRWREPYRFRMVTISKAPHADCLDADDPDGQYRQLLHWVP